MIKFYNGSASCNTSNIKTMLNIETISNKLFYISTIFFFFVISFILFE